MKNLIDGLTILYNYSTKSHLVGCEHDELHIYVLPEVVSTPDKIRLEELGFSVNYDVDGFTYRV